MDTLKPLEKFDEQMISELTEAILDGYAKKMRDLIFIYGIDPRPIFGDDIVNLLIWR